MEQVEMIEKLREKADVTFDEARQILETTDWNLLDALVALEKEGKIKETKQMSYTTKQDDMNNFYEDTTKTLCETVGDGLKKAMVWCRKMLLKGMDNKLLITSSKGQSFEIPVTILVIFMIPAFWLIIAGLMIAFFSGCKFRFTGPDLGTEKVNSVMDKIEFSHKSEENINVDVDDRK